MRVRKHGSGGYIGVGSDGRYVAGTHRESWIGATFASVFPPFILWLILITLTLSLGAVLSMRVLPTNFQMYSYVSSEGTTKVGRTTRSAEGRMNNYTGKHGLQAKQSTLKVWRGIASNADELKVVDAKIKQALSKWQTAKMGATELYALSQKQVQRIIDWTLFKHHVGVIAKKSWLKILAAFYGLIALLFARPRTAT